MYNDETTLFGVQERIVALQSLFVWIDIKKNMLKWNNLINKKLCKITKISVKQLRIHEKLSIRYINSYILKL